MTSRRDFIRGLSAAALAMHAAPAVFPWAMPASESGAIAIPSEDELLIRSFRFVDLESPVEYLSTWLTPIPRFFVRNHMLEPSQLRMADWRLSIGGEVEKPLTLTLADLSKLEMHSVVNTLECAGNGRGFQRPQVPGVQWGKGAVGTAKFSGARLRDVLERAGLKSSGKHIAFRGLDEVPGKVPPFIRSIPIEKALDPDTLIATHMNGAPLTKHHGFPARALTPGWIGAASCKWLTEIKVLDSEFAGNFMNPGYRLPNQPLKPGETVNPEDTHTVTSLAVKSVISGPLDGATLKPGRIAIHGAAWAGEAGIAKVEISTDGGATWTTANFAQERARYAWRLWHQEWMAKPGDHSIRSRATDSRGRVQPATAAWNPSGYLYNAIDEVRVHVA
jgi:sulfite oxidase